MTKMEWMETKLRAHKILKKMLIECADNMVNVGLPIQIEKVNGIFIQKVKGAQAFCAFVPNEENETTYSIIIDEEFANHIDDDVVVNNVKDSIYHELLHTCENCQTHNEDWLEVAVKCDAKLGSHTRTRQDDEIYYNATKCMEIFTYECEHCGFRFDTIKDYGKYIICPIDKEKIYKR